MCVFSLVALQRTDKSLFLLMNPQSLQFSSSLRWSPRQQEDGCLIWLWCHQHATPCLLTRAAILHGHDDVTVTKEHATPRDSCLVLNSVWNQIVVTQLVAVFKQCTLKSTRLTTHTIDHTHLQVCVYVDERICVGVCVRSHQSWGSACWPLPCLLPHVSISVFCYLYNMPLSLAMLLDLRTTEAQYRI